MWPCLYTFHHGNILGSIYLGMHVMLYGLHSIALDQGVLSVFKGFWFSLFQMNSCTLARLRCMVEIFVLLVGHENVKRPD